MRRVAERVFEPLRREVSKGPLAVTSFYRSVVVNRAVGGSVSSQHTRGEAMDIDADVYGGCTNRELFDYVRGCLEFDQLIWEFGDDRSPDWIHVSLKARDNRHQVFAFGKARRENMLSAVMKRVSIVAVVMALGCAPVKTVTRSMSDSVVVRETVRDTVIELSPDSSLVRALIECDSLGRARLSELLDYRAGDRISPPVITMVDNILTAKAQVDSFKIYARLKRPLRGASHFGYGCRRRSRSIS